MDPEKIFVVYIRSVLEREYLNTQFILSRSYLASASNIGLFLI